MWLVVLHMQGICKPYRQLIPQNKPAHLAFIYIDVAAVPPYQHMLSMGFVSPYTNPLMVDIVFPVLGAAACA